MGTRPTESESCFRLIYRSHSRLGGGGKDTDGLADILKVSRANNQAAGITGALVLYNDWFAQVREGPETEVTGLYERIKRDPRHDALEVREAAEAPGRLFSRWAMALVAEHGEPDVPLIATTGGVSEAAPWRVTLDQERVLTQLRDLTRGYGIGA